VERQELGLEAAELVAQTEGAAAFRGVPVLHMASSQACTDEGGSEPGREERWVAPGEEQTEGQG
jgi:hypothetical protein